MHRNLTATFFQNFITVFYGTSGAVHDFLLIRVTDQAYFPHNFSKLFLATFKMTTAWVLIILNS